MATETPPGKDEMIPCGSYTMRESSEDRTVSDGINGTISLREAWVESADAGANEHVWLHAEANGESVDVVRQIHANGKSVSLPLEKRKELNLNPGDEVAIWISGVDEDIIPGEVKGPAQKTETEEATEMDRRVVIFADDPFTYHYVEGDGETNCGISLNQNEYRHGADEMPESYDQCPDCVIRSSEELTNEDIINWLSQEAGFEKSGGAPSYMTHEQLVAIRDGWLEMKERIEELEQELNNQDGV